MNIKKQCDDQESKYYFTNSIDFDADSRILLFGNTDII